MSEDNTTDLTKLIPAYAPVIAPRTTILDLATETRQIIYGFVFATSAVAYDVSSPDRSIFLASKDGQEAVYGTWPFSAGNRGERPSSTKNYNPLLLVSKQVYLEAVRVFYAEVKFVLHRFNSPKSSLPGIAWSTTRVQKLVFHTYVFQIRKKLPKFPNLKEITLRREILSGGYLSINRPNFPWELPLYVFEKGTVLQRLEYTPDNPAGPRITALRGRIPAGASLTISFSYGVRYVFPVLGAQSTPEHWVQEIEYEVTKGTYEAGPIIHKN